MKNLILKITISIFALSLSVSVLNADVYNTSSLIALEGSYGMYDVENDDVPALDDREIFSGAGIKIGAQTNNYRLFLSFRNNFVDGYDSSYSYGLEAQYLMNFSKYVNLYLGVNGGMINSIFDDSLANSREVESSYVGGDVGVNLHLGSTIDFEIGARLSVLNDPINIQNGVEYTFGYISTGYASFIIKYDMD